MTRIRSVIALLARLIKVNNRSLLSGLQVDLMATPFNRRLREFICPFEHPSAAGTDIRVQDLNRWNAVYVFPPHKMLLEVLNLFRGFRGVAGESIDLSLD